MPGVVNIHDKVTSNLSGVFLTSEGTILGLTKIDENYSIREPQVKLWDSSRNRPGLAVGTTGIDEGFRCRFLDEPFFTKGLLRGGISRYSFYNSPDMAAMHVASTQEHTGTRGGGARYSILACPACGERSPEHAEGRSRTK